MTDGKNVICSGGFGTGSSITFNLDSSDMPISLPTDYLEFKQDNLAEENPTRLHSVG